MALEGNLADMPLVDLLRIFQRGARSGRLLLWGEAEWSIVWLREGEVAHAVVLSQRDRHPIAAGEPAFFHVLSWAEGQFRFLASSQPEMYLITIRRPTASLIVEALRRRSGQAARPLPANLTAWTLLHRLPQPVGSNETIRMTRQEWLALARIEQPTTATAVASAASLSVQQTLAIIARLIDLGVVAPAPLADLPARRIAVAPPAAPDMRQDAPTSVSRLTLAIRRRLSQISAAST